MFAITLSQLTNGLIGGIKASTQEVPMPVLPLAVHALSRTQLCLSGIDATSMLVVKKLRFESYLLLQLGLSLRASRDIPLPLSILS